MIKMIKSFSTLSKFLFAFALIVGAGFLHPHIKASAYNSDILDYIPSDVATKVIYITNNYYNGDSNNLEFIYGKYYPNASFPDGTWAILVYTPVVNNGSNELLSLDYGSKNTNYVSIIGNCYTNGVFCSHSTVNSGDLFPNDYNFEYRTSFSNSYFSSLWRSWSPNGGFGSYLPIVLYGSPSEIDNRDTTNILYNTVEPSDSSVDKNSDLGLIVSLYDITFRPLYVNNDLNNAYSKYLDHPYSVYLQKIQSDNGYNMLSLQCPDLPADNPLICFYGQYVFTPKHNSNDFSVTDFTLSFAVDVPDFSELPELYVPDDSFFVLEDLRTNQTFSPVTLTVNRLIVSNPFGGVFSYRNKELKAFDYNKSGDSYPLFVFYGSANPGVYTAGSFLYNFGYSDMKDNGVSLTPEDIDIQKKNGDSDNDNTRDTAPYVTRSVVYPDTDLPTFVDPSIGDYDFRSLSDVFHSLFNDYIIELMLACASIGLIGYILFGKVG